MDKDDYYRNKGLNDIKSDDFLIKTFTRMLNLAVSQFEVNPKYYKIGENDQPPRMNVGFSAILTLNNTNNFTLDNVLLQVFDSNNKEVFRDNNVVFSNNNNIIHYQGTIPNYQLQAGNNPWKIVINSDRKIIEYNGKEDPYADNQAITNSYIDKKKPNQDEQLIKCDSRNLRNTWSVIFNMTRKNGSMKSRTVTSCGKDGCKTETIYWCENVKYTYWKETRNYYENFGIDAVMFRSPSTISEFGGDGWVNILGNNKAKVRAGQWYEYYIVTRYSTNRNSMPETWYSDMCNYQTRNPNSTAITNVQYISLKTSGFGETEYFPVIIPYSSSGNWYDNRKNFRVRYTNDSFNQTQTRIFVPVTAENGEIRGDIITLPFDGHRTDKNHPKIKLQECISFKIKIEDPLPIGSQIIGES